MKGSQKKCSIAQTKESFKTILNQQLFHSCWAGKLTIKVGRNIFIVTKKIDRDRSLSSQKWIFPHSLLPIMFCETKRWTHMNCMMRSTPYLKLWLFALNPFILWFATLNCVISRRRRHKVYFFHEFFSSKTCHRWLNLRIFPARYGGFTNCQSLTLKKFFNKMHICDLSKQPHKLLHLFTACKHKKDSFARSDWMK